MLWGAFAILYIVWGSTYLAIRFALESIPPFLMASMRFLIAGVLLYIWRRAKGREVLGWRQWRATAIGGALLLLCGNGGVVWSEQFVASGTVALLVGTVPLWMTLAEAVVDRRVPQTGVLLGVSLGFLGTLLLVGPTPEFSFRAQTGVWIVLGAALSWALGSTYLKRAPLPADTLMAASMEMLAGGTMLLLLSGLSGEWKHFRIQEVTAGSFWSLAYLVGMGSIVGFSVYAWLLKKASVTQVGTYAYVNPVVAVILGAWLAHEPLSWRVVSAGGIILLGVILVLRFSKEPSVEPQP